VEAELVTLMCGFADTAGAIIRSRFRQAFTMTDKADRSPVTEIDCLVETAIREGVARHRPADGIIGEEFGNERPDAEVVWVVDPIDGTRAFLSGRPTFVCLIGVLFRGEPLLGLIDQPISGERWLGRSGAWATFNGVGIHARSCAGLAGAVLSATTPEQFDPLEWCRFQALARRCRVNVFGGDGYGFGLLASGYQDMIAEADLKFYDFAPIVPIVTGAGGLMTDWAGRTLGRGGDGRVLAAGDARCHAAALAVLNG